MISRVVNRLHHIHLGFVLMKKKENKNKLKYKVQILEPDGEWGNKFYVEAKNLNSALGSIQLGDWKKSSSGVYYDFFYLERGDDEDTLVIRISLVQTTKI